MANEKTTNGNVQVDGSVVHSDPYAADAALLRLEKQRLADIEATRIIGAPSRTPKQQLLDATDIQRRMPDKRLRWINIRDQEVAEARKLAGYTILSEAEGGRRIGDESALAAIDRGVYDARIAEQQRLNRARLSAHRDEVERVVEDVRREMHDRYGIDSKLLIKD